MYKDKASHFYLITTIILWSATPAFATIALKELNNFQLLFYVCIIATISLFIAVLLSKRLPILMNYSKKDIITMSFMGIIGIFFYHICLFGSFTCAPAGQVNVANYLWPIFIIIFSVPILKEKFNFLTIIAVIISFAGVFLSLTRGKFSDFDPQHILGYLLASLGAVLYGLFSVLGKKYNYDRITSMCVYYASSTILIIPTTLIVTEIVIPKTPSTIISLLILGIIMNSVAFIMWFKALHIGHTHTTANTVYIIPFLAMIWTFLLNNEPFSMASLAGLVLIIIGISIQTGNRIHKRRIL